MIKFHRKVTLKLKYNVCFLIRVYISKSYQTNIDLAVIRRQGLLIFQETSSRQFKENFNFSIYF